ncbi:hypothetical protein RYX36_007884 [Vicia faba]
MKMLRKHRQDFLSGRTDPCYAASVQLRPTATNSPLRVTQTPHPSARSPPLETSFDALSNCRRHDLDACRLCMSGLEQSSISLKCSKF